MRLLTAVAALAFGFAALQSASAASGGLQSGRSETSSQGTPAPHTGMPPVGRARPGFPHTGFPRVEGPHTGFPRTGMARPRFRAGLYGGAVIGVPLLESVGPQYPYDVYPYAYPPPEYGAPYIPPDDRAPPDSLPPATGYEPPDSPQQGIWYFCPEPMGFFPYVQDCAVPWQAVPASALPPPAPQQ